MSLPFTACPDDRGCEPDGFLPTAPRTCWNCEYFDRGLTGDDGVSDCLNHLSPRFQTHREAACLYWVRSST